MINLWELIAADSNQMSESPPPETPHTILDHSKMCFETLMRLYYLRHGFEAADLFSMHYLTVLSFMSVAKLKTLASSATPSLAAVDDARATLILAAKGLRDQGQNYYLSHTMYHLVRSQASSEDAELMLKFVHVRKEESEAWQLRSRHVQSQFPVNIIQITEDPENKRLSNMIKQYADMALESASQMSSSESESESSPRVTRRRKQ